MLVALFVMLEESKVVHMTVQIFVMMRIKSAGKEMRDLGGSWTAISSRFIVHDKKLGIPCSNAAS
jgi:hypothetical protein